MTKAECSDAWGVNVWGPSANADDQAACEAKSGCTWDGSASQCGGTTEAANVVVDCGSIPNNDVITLPGVKWNHSSVCHVLGLKG